MIKVVGVKQMTKNYARTFVPTMTKDAYAIKQISDRPNFADSDIPTLFSELIEKAQMFLMSLKLSLKSAVKNSVNNLCK